VVVSPLFLALWKGQITSCFLVLQGAAAAAAATAATAARLPGPESLATKMLRLRQWVKERLGPSTAHHPELEAEMAAVMRDAHPEAIRAVVVSALRLEDGESSPVVFEWYIKSRPVEFYQALVMLVCKDGAHLSNGMQWLDALSPGVFRVRDSARSVRTRAAALAHNHLKEPPLHVVRPLVGPVAASLQHRHHYPFTRGCAPDPSTAGQRSIATRSCLVGYHPYAIGNGSIGCGTAAPTVRAGSEGQRSLRMAEG
jgi:hypothetical protein